jgi:hypothetical protein
MFDVDKAVQYLDSHAQPHSIHRCAHYTADAITMPAAGGQPMTRVEDAKNFGPQLEAAGFREVTDGTLQKGDVAVIQPYAGGNPSGHMTMFDGTNWVSDFNQGPSMYPGPGYRAKKPPYKIYRYQGGGSGGSGVQAVTKHGSLAKTGAHHNVHVGPNKRHLSHKHAELEGGYKVAQGSATVFVGVEQHPVARIGDATTDGSPIAVGESSVLVG